MMSHDTLEFKWSGSRGSAAAQCGKASPYRWAWQFLLRLRLELGA